MYITLVLELEMTTMFHAFLNVKDSANEDEDRKDDLKTFLIGCRPGACSIN